MSIRQRRDADIRSSQGAQGQPNPVSNQGPLGESRQGSSSLQPVANDSGLFDSCDGPRRTLKGKRAFDQGGDLGYLPSGYKLNFIDMESVTSCKFALVGRETMVLTLVKDRKETVEVPTEGGMIEINLTYVGVDDMGKKLVEYAVEGNIADVRDVLERSRQVGKKVTSFFDSLKPHLPEIITGAFGVALGVAAFNLEWIKDVLGNYHTYAVLGVSGVIEGLAVWCGIERRRDRSKEE